MEREVQCILQQFEMQATVLNSPQVLERPLSALCAGSATCASVAPCQQNWHQVKPTWTKGVSTRVRQPSRQRHITIPSSPATSHDIKNLPKGDSVFQLWLYWQIKQLW
jgi:hypothetical protein